MALASQGAVTLVSGDGQRFTVSLEVIRIFRALDTMVENLGSDGDEPIPLPNITGVILGKVIAWAERHSSQTTPPINEIAQTGAESFVPHQPVVPARVPQRKGLMPDTEIIPTTWEQNFLDKNKDVLYNILLAANYLDAKRLMDILCLTIASLIKGKDPADIRKTFHVEGEDSTTYPRGE